MEGNKKLTKQENQQYTRLKNMQNGVDQRTFDLCLSYFIEYKTNSTAHISVEKLPILFKSALFMAQKSQNIENIKGQRIALPSLTLGALLKNHHLDEVMITIKDISKHVKIQNKQAAFELTNLIKQISFLITFHKKFEKSIEKLDLKERNSKQNDQYVKIWCSTTWLLYILAKGNVLNKSNELIENTCMLAHTIAFMLSLGWGYLLPRSILRQEGIPEQASLKEVLPYLRDKILEMFSIKTVDVYAGYAGQFEKYFEQELIGKNIIKSSQNQNDYLSPQYITINNKRLDKYYEKILKCNELDERIFLKERTNNLTPSKFTPFARQGYANKGRKTNNDTTLKQNFSSHRLLNFEMMEKQDTVVKPTSDGMNMAKLPKNIMISPITVKAPLICATPITAGMEMYNYVNEKSRKFKQILGLGQTVKRPYEHMVVKYIEMTFQKSKKDFDKKTREIREGLIYSFFKLGLEDFLAQNPSQIENQGLYKGMMTMSIEIVLFVSNSPLSFDDVANEIKVPPFQLWKACDFYLKFDKSMPSSLKLHLLDLQVGLISWKMWSDENNVKSIGYFINDINKEERKGSVLQKVFRRLLHQTAFQINQMGSSLKLDEGIIENVYEIMKNIYRQHSDLMLNRNIDQLIMCAIFSLSRKEKLQIKFAQIIDVYQQMNPHNKEYHQQIIYKIPIEQRQPINIITYYNQFFIQNLKQYILNIKIIINELKRHYNPSSILMSPLKEILPRDINNKKIYKKSTKDGNTNLLLAYTDSPMLKIEPMTVKTHNFQSRRIIDFDQEQEKYYNKQLDQEKQNTFEKLSPKNFVNLPAQITKKFSNGGNLAWKNQPSNLNSITPTRMNKNGTNHLGNIQLNQFSINPTPPIGRMGSNTNKIQQNGQNGQTFGKANYRMTYI